MARRKRAFAKGEGENMWVQTGHLARAATGDASLGSGAKPDGRPDAD